MTVPENQPRATAKPTLPQVEYQQGSHSPPKNFFRTGERQTLIASDAQE